MLKKTPKSMFQLRSRLRLIEQGMAAVGEKCAQTEGLCESDLRILEMLKIEDLQAVNVLGAKVGLTSGSVTAAMKRLEAKGFVKRRPHEDDRRKVVVMLKKPGKQWLKSVRKRHAAMISNQLKPLSDREQHVFAQLLARLCGEED